jgi:hypothetical protein
MNLLCGLGNTAVTKSQHCKFYKHFIYPKRVFVKKNKNSLSSSGITYFQNIRKPYQPIVALRNLAFFYILYKT